MTRIGSLFSGTGALDLAVQAVLGGDVAWHSQYEPPDKNGRPNHQFTARVLARHWPGVPNLGDITAIDWHAVLDAHGPVDILTGGFPCTDVSSAGRRAGLTPDTRSGLWSHMARAIAVLQPRIVVIENVEGLLSAPAASDMEPCPHCVGDTDAEPPLRALGAVLGDLAALGLDAEWARVAASEVGAPHRRRRVFLLAWQAVANPENLGRQRSRPARRRGHGPADGRDATADPGREGLEVGRVEPTRHEREAAERGRREPAAHTPGERRDEGRSRAEGQRRGPDVALGGSPAAADAHGRRLPRHSELPAGRDAVQLGVWHDADGRLPTPADTDSIRRRADLLQLRPGQPDLGGSDYGPAIHRWERVLGRPAPWPTTTVGQLNPAFSEWMQGLPDGWVTCTPGPDGMTPAAIRAAMLHALGNGVVPQQAAAALRLLLDRATTP